MQNALENLTETLLITYIILFEKFSPYLKFWGAFKTVPNICEGSLWWKQWSGSQMFDRVLNTCPQKNVLIASKRLSWNLLMCHGKIHENISNLIFLGYIIVVNKVVNKLRKRKQSWTHKKLNITRESKSLDFHVVPMNHKL